MSKAVVLVLEPRFESEYGEHANLAVLNAHGDVIGWTGGEVPESGHPCEHNVMDDEGFALCASSSEILRLRDENAKLRDLCAKMFQDFFNCNFELERLAHRTFDASRYYYMLQELGIVLWKGEQE